MLKMLYLISSTLLLPLINMKNHLHITISITMISTLMFSKILFSNICILTYNSFYIDSINAPLIILSIWISALMNLMSYSQSKKKKKSFLINLMLLILLLAFSSSNMLMFYILFEASLIPIFLLILGWGYQPERLQATFYLLMYTITASLPLLLSMMISMNASGHLSITNQWKTMSLSSNIQTLWWLAIIFAFLVKMPMFLMHLWLPKAHVEAPVAGSMILAAILLKLGSYGLIRMICMFPPLNKLSNSLISSISMSGAVITSLICLRQSDLKSLIAYSSVGHMGLLTAGIMSNSMTGLFGATLMMIAHGLSSSALFALSFITYQSTHTRNLFLTKGLSMLFPHMSMLWFIILAANMAAPPTINLFSEIILIMSILSFSPSMWLLVSMTSFMSAAYTLFLYTASQHGTLPKFLNPMSITSQSSYTTIFMHLTPILLIMLKPDIIFL